jgi:hypothetical protein
MKKVRMVTKGRGSEMERVGCMLRNAGSYYSALIY